MTRSRFFAAALVVAALFVGNAGNADAFYLKFEGEITSSTSSPSFLGPLPQDYFLEMFVDEVPANSNVGNSDLVSATLTFPDATGGPVVLTAPGRITVANDIIGGSITTLSDVLFFHADPVDPGTGLPGGDTLFRFVAPSGTISDNGVNFDNIEALAKLGTAGPILNFGPAFGLEVLTGTVALAPIPEPSSGLAMAMLVFGGFGANSFRRRRRREAA